MNEFFNNLSSASWWLSVVAVGIIINLVSHYAQKSLDSQLSSVSTRWKKLSDKKKQKMLKEIELLRSNPQEQVLASFTELRYRIRGTMNAVLAVGFAVLSSFLDTVATDSPSLEEIPIKIFRILMLAMSVISIFIALMDHQEGVKTKETRNARAQERRSFRCNK